MFCAPLLFRFYEKYARALRQTASVCLRKIISAEKRESGVFNHTFPVRKASVENIGEFAVCRAKCAK
jgi:hypothetical protein